MHGSLCSSFRCSGCITWRTGPRTACRERRRQSLIIKGFHLLCPPASLPRAHARHITSSGWPDTRFSLLQCLSSFPPSQPHCLPCACSDPSPLPGTHSSPTYSKTPFLPNIPRSTFPEPCSVPSLLGKFHQAKLTPVSFELLL